MKSILIGNGLNIQFGGMAYTSNFIMKRIKYRAKLGAYTHLFNQSLKSEDILGILNGFVNISNEIIDDEYDKYINDVDTQDALIDFKRRYTKISTPYDIMLEDWFFLLHMFFLKNSDISNNIVASKHGFEMLILDAIYNSGKIQSIYQSMNKKVKRYFLSFDNIFTLNYDNNIEKLTGKPVYHLHGDFSVIQNGIKDMEHCFCNALLNYSGKLKLKEAENNPIYGFNEFNNIQDELYVVGMSPNNDSHIFECINKNSKLTKVNFYCHSDEEREYIDKNLPKELYESKNVCDLWIKLDSCRKTFCCNYSIPSSKEVDNFFEVFNALSDDKIAKEQIIKEINTIPQFEMDRLCILVKDDLKKRNPENKSTDEEGFEESSASISYIALQEGILPSVLYMICVMNFDKAKELK